MIFDLHPLFQEYNYGIKQRLYVLLNGRCGSFEHWVRRNRDAVMICFQQYSIIYWECMRITTRKLLGNVMKQD